MNALLMLALQNTCVALVLALLVYGLTRVWRNPPLAHVLWLLVLLKLVAPPVLRLDWPEFWPSEISRADDQAVDQQPAIVGSSIKIQAESQAEIVARPTAPATVPAPILKGHAFAAAIRLIWDPAIRVLFWLWLGGVAWCGVIAVRRIVRFERMLQGALPASERLQRLAVEVAGRLSLRRVPLVRFAESVEVPLLWCAGRRPTIVLPGRSASQLDEQSLQLILAHELAHLRRRDHWVRSAELLVSILYWWNPLVWVIRRQIHDAEDLCCDAWVRWAFPDSARQYAEVLLRAAESLSARQVGARLLPASLFLHSLSLKARIQMILESRFAPSVSKKSLLVIALVAVLVLPSLADSTKTLAWAESNEQAPVTQAQDHANPDDLQLRIVGMRKQIEEMQKAVASLEKEAEAKLREPGVCDTTFLTNRFVYRVPFEIGLKQNQEGGQIEIREVWGTRPRIEIGGQYLVRGKYVLPPGQHGKLYFYATAGGPWGKTASLDLQSTLLDKQEGEFALVHGMAGPGAFHLILTSAESYSHWFANVYFGTGDNVQR